MANCSSILFPFSILLYLFCLGIPASAPMPAANGIANADKPPVAASKAGLVAIGATVPAACIAVPPIICPFSTCFVPALLKNPPAIPPIAPIASPVVLLDFVLNKPGLCATFSIPSLLILARYSWYAGF